MKAIIQKTKKGSKFCYCHSNSVLSREMFGQEPKKDDKHIIVLQVAFLEKHHAYDMLVEYEESKNEEE